MDWQLDGLRQRLYDGLIDSTMLFTQAIILEKYTPTRFYNVNDCHEYSTGKNTALKQNKTLLKTSGQIKIFHQPTLPWNKGIPLLNHHLRWRRLRSL